MKSLIMGLILVASAGHADTKTVWKSVYTDVKNDCITVSQGNAKAEIDFYSGECKSFGGFQLKIEGGDLRYAPHLYFKGIEISLVEPGAFHDVASNKIEWVYQSTMDQIGSGSIEWKGLIYRLSVANEGGDGSKDRLYVVRLDGEKSCSLGTAADNVAARNMVYDLKLNCK